MNELILAFFLGNIGCLMGYFRVHKVGWYDWIEPTVMFFVFLFFGIPWLIVVSILNLLFKDAK
jgi:hypothetical protein